MLRLLAPLVFLAVLGCNDDPAEPCGPGSTDPACLDAGGSLDGGAERDGAPEDAGEDRDAAEPVDAGPCGGACGGDTPACDAESGTCVECTPEEDDACGGATPACDPGRNVCAECGSDADCTDPSAARCDGGSCGPCVDDDNCRGVEGLSRCAAEVCVECAPEFEGIDCRNNACDPVSLECTGSVRASVGICGPCRADSECEAPGRCIELAFEGAPRGAYCMPPVMGAGCDEPGNRLPFLLEDRTTRNGVGPNDYCGINEALTTCEAIAATVNAQACEGAPCPEGGRCEEVATGRTQCTHSCAGGDCIQGYVCPTEAGDPFCLVE